MGLELDQCVAVIQGSESRGKLHVDSNELCFRSKDLRWSVKVGKGTSAKVVENDLVVRRGSKTASFRVGTGAEKWADKVLNPPSRGKKLGLKPDHRYWIRGDFDPSFLIELADHGLVKAARSKSCDIAFVLILSQADLKAFDKIAATSAVGTHLWAVYQKGKDAAIGQTAVMAQAKENGMGPGKGIAFDDVYSAMRFTKK
ncbi:MAG: hypothetical protein AAFX06_13030 [Planctomycetota bacterium]